MNCNHGQKIAPSAWSLKAIPLGGQRVCWRVILTVDQWCFVPIGECTWDNGGHVHKRGFSMCMDTFL